MKKPNPVDVHVGARIRARRLQLELTQENVGEALGLTFQQVQKYERGTNRIAGENLVRMAWALRTNVGYFFEGLPAVVAGDAPPDPVAAMLATAEGAALARHFAELTSLAARRHLVTSARDLSIMLRQPIHPEPLQAAE